MPVLDASPVRVLAEVAHRALARDPADRFPNVTAFRTALLPFAG